MEGDSPSPSINPIIGGIKMAETKTKSAPQRVLVTLPLNKGRNAVQEEFFSVNGKNYIIQRGEEVEIPVEVAEVIKNAEREEVFSMRYVNKLSQNEIDKKKELGL